jgi:hypothetical protein
VPDSIKLLYVYMNNYSFLFLFEVSVLLNIITSIT